MNPPQALRSRARWPTFLRPAGALLTAILRALRAALSRRSDSRRAQDVIDSGAAGRDSIDLLISAGHRSTQGVRPYGRGY